jgi:hypothetical protein
MPFCPKCRTEYVEGVTNCSDCGEPLAAELPPLPDDLDADYELLTEGQDEVTVQVIVAELEAAGIPYVVAGDEIGTVKIYPAQDSRILVLRPYLAQAQQILEVTLAEPSEDEMAAAAEGGIFFCDHCGAEVPAKSTRCPACGEPFEGSEP